MSIRVPTIPLPVEQVKVRLRPELPAARLTDAWCPEDDIGALGIAGLARFARSLIREDGTLLTAEQVADAVGYDIASVPQAEAGAVNTVVMTPLRVKQAIIAQVTLAFLEGLGIEITNDALLITCPDAVVRSIPLTNP